MTVPMWYIYVSIVTNFICTVLLIWAIADYIEGKRKITFGDEDGK